MPFIKIPHMEVGVKIVKSRINPIICLFIVLLLGAVAFGDTIKLKDGSVLKGKVVSYSQRKFTIIVYIGGSTSQHVIPVDEIESVEFDSSGGPVAADLGVARDETTRPAELSQVGRTTRDNPSQPPAGETPVTDSGTANVIAEKTVSVAAAADWTSTEIRVQRGQRIIINASGEVDLGDNQRSSPDGLNTSDNRKLLPNRPTGALIAVVGDDNDDFIFIGGSAEFNAPHNGILFLSVNEGNLKDNNGAFVARVRVLSNR